MNLTEMNELMFREEELCAELKPYVSEGKLGTVLHHPLVIEIFFQPERCALVNKRFKLKKQHTQEAFEQKNWHSFVALHERPYRFEAMMKVFEVDQQIHDLISWVWSDSENIRQHIVAWRTLFKGLPDKHRLTDEEDRKFYDELPDELTVHRGWHRPGTWRGLSWTTDSKKALWFAERLAEQARPIVTTGKVNKHDIIACFVGRSEKEVVVFPEHIRVEKKQMIFSPTKKELAVLTLCK